MAHWAALSCCMALLAGLHSTARADRYQYDTHGRLISVVYDSGKVLTYTYDTNGNLERRKVDTRVDHTADQNGNGVITLSELLRVIQFYNSNGLHCQAGTEDGYAPGPGDTSCAAHASDYNPQNWIVSLSELLRVIQFYNSAGYIPCPGATPATEDGFCPLGAAQ